jgi:hypothetical protein
MNGLKRIKDKALLKPGSSTKLCATNTAEFECHCRVTTCARPRWDQRIKSKNSVYCNCIDFHSFVEKRTLLIDFCSLSVASLVRFLQLQQQTILAGNPSHRSLRKEGLNHLIGNRLHRGNHQNHHGHYHRSKTSHEACPCHSFWRTRRVLLWT